MIAFTLAHRWAYPLGLAMARPSPSVVRTVTDAVPRIGFGANLRELLGKNP